jgi:AraC-like DNA-binding protein
VNPRETKAIREGVLNRRPQKPTARISPSFLRLGVLDVNSPRYFSPHRHNDYEVILVDRGCYSCLLNGRKIDLPAGDGVVVRPGDVHEDRMEGPFPMRYFALVFVFRSEPLRPEPPELFAPDCIPELQRFHLELDRVWPLVLGIQKEFQAGDLFSGQVQDALLQAFFWRMVRALPRQALSSGFVDISTDQVFAERITQVFRAHLGEDLSVSQIARHLGMSESALSHKCRRLLDTSPRRAFLACKMDRARYLLTCTDLSVKQVAAQLGYRDPYSFSRAFKSVTGQAPSACRNGQVLQQG